MPYRNLECDSEKTYRWHLIEDIRQKNDPMTESITEQLKDDIGSILMQIGGITPEQVADILEKYVLHIKGIQTIYCPSCKHLQIDVIVNDQTKVREDLWRSYETDRFVRQFMGGNNGRR